MRFSESRNQLNSISVRCSKGSGISRARPDAARACKHATLPTPHSYTVEFTYSKRNGSMTRSLSASAASVTLVSPLRHLPIYSFDGKRRFPEMRHLTVQMTGNRPILSKRDRARSHPLGRPKSPNVVCRTPRKATIFILTAGYLCCGHKFESCF